MFKIINIFILAIYTLGIFLLPSGDFSSIRDLPEMYQHCKATEDKDMTLFDFITDHLLNIDGLFDKHNNTDEQKPHIPIKIHQIQTTFFLITNFTFLVTPILSELIKISYPTVYYVQLEYVRKHFQPPRIS